MFSISIILLVHEDQKYELKQSLESIHNQTVAVDEVVIIDSSSNNYNYNFIKDSLRDNEKYVFVDKESKVKDFSDFGYFEIGSKNSTYDYLSFLKAGDVWNPKKNQFVTEVINKDSPDILIHSCLQKVCFNDEKILVNDYFDSPLFAVFYLHFAFSAAVIKRNVFFALEEFSYDELKSLNVSFIEEVLGAQVSNVEKDWLKMESSFWKDNYEWFKKKELLQNAALFCIRVFQKAVPSQNSYRDFARNVQLSSADCITVLFGQKSFTEIVDIEPDRSDLILAERRQKQYLFVRNWLEFKILGGKISARLNELNVSKIAIYGAGKHGSILCNELQHSDIEISFWIDSSPKISNIFGIPVYNTFEAKDKVDDVDAVIVTPFLEFNEISELLRRVGFKKILSITDITK